MKAIAIKRKKMEKKKYMAPLVKQIEIDKDISLQLSSVDALPEYENESYNIMLQKGAENPYKMA